MGSTADGMRVGTSATSSRKQNSKLPFKRPTRNAGQCSGCAMDSIHTADSSDTIVSSGDYRRRRVPQNNTMAEG
ncbi:hypothetical protein [Desulfosporosinus shakirovi]|uniref:hypothetical protein n=1 Tax=Desulfosporosinus shakirovi TaxID=2885154 RepID=UPI001E28721C|nr:hypothetical protein [Desulfosporosinus sp. SRJS8]MCB8814082.1 hypothetical protein [Desulfosporosinus sp. SRJS8]